MPAWRQGVAVGEWRQIPGTALSSAPIAVPTYPGLGNTGPNSKVVAWTGFSIDTRDSSIYSTANGGHSDYAGNEVNRIRLSDNAPAWTEPRASTTASQVSVNSTHYADGRPTSRHTYYGSVFNESRGRAMILGGARYGDGYMAATFDGFNLTNNDWDSARTYPDVPSDFTNMQGAAVTLDKKTGNVYVFANFNVLRWNNSSNSWSRLLTSTSIYGQYAATAMDTKRNRVLVVGGNVNDRGLYDATANTVQSVSFTGSSAGVMTGDTGNGLVYDAVLDVFLLRKADAGGTIYRINPQTFAVDVLPTTAGDQVPSAPNAVWTRFLQVPNLKGVVYFPTYAGNAWFLRTN